MDSATEMVREPVRIRGTRGVTLAGELVVPRPAAGLVVFAHRSGTGRTRERNHALAAALDECDLATLLVDLLTPQEATDEEHTHEYRYDIGLLARRVIDAIDWARTQAPLASLPIALCAASTGTAAALVAAAERPDAVHAIVSRGGRPDLAGDALERVQAPTLLVVGSRDEPLAALNRDAMQRLGAHVELAIVPGASRLMDDRTAFDEVARLAAAWCQRYLWSMA